MKAKRFTNFDVIQYIVHDRGIDTFLDLEKEDQEFLAIDEAIENPNLILDDYKDNIIDLLRLYNKAEITNQEFADRFIKGLSAYVGDKLDKTFYAVYHGQYVFTPRGQKAIEQIKLEEHLNSSDRL